MKRKRIIPVIGIIGSSAIVITFIEDPSFPTPDKLIIFLFFVFLIFEQATEMLKHLLPFAVLIIIYESFRGVADNLNKHVNYSLAPHFDRTMFGNLPTVYLQNWLWRGYTRWYDVILYIPYLLFFIMPFALALLVWKTRPGHYWRAVTAYMLVFFSAFLTFLVFPAAPPWLASQNGYIPHITRISSYVWDSLGIHNFPSVYNHISANPVAAIPSLHSACSTLFSLIIFRLYGWRWGALSLIYPISIYFGVIYEGEHYAFDVIAGLLYAICAFLVAPRFLRWLTKIWRKTKVAYPSNTKSALKPSR